MGGQGTRQSIKIPSSNLPPEAGKRAGVPRLGANV